MIKQYSKLSTARRTLGVLVAGATLALPALAAKPIIHDGEQTFLEAQYKEAWQKENAEIDQKLESLRQANGG